MTIGNPVILEFVIEKFLFKLFGGRYEARLGSRTAIKCKVSVGLILVLSLIKFTQLTFQLASFLLPIKYSLPTGTFKL